MDPGIKKKSTLTDLHMQAIKESRATARSEQKPVLTQLLDLQSQRNELYERYLSEVRLLQGKYEEMYTPLYQQRGELTASVDGFWLNAMKNNAVVAAYVEPRDEELLRWLKDVRCVRDQNSENFTLVFEFGENQIIGNNLLEKAYVLASDSVIEKAIGTDITWLSENYTQRQTNRKQVHKVSKKTRTVQRIVTCNSFFNFFRSVVMPAAQELTDMDISAEEAIAAAIEEDFELACEIRDELIPNAVYHYLQVDGKSSDDLKDVEEEERKKPERSDCKHM